MRSLQLSVPQLLTCAQVQPGMRVGNFFAGRGHLALPAAHAVGASGRVFAIDQTLEWLSQLQSSARDAALENIHTMHLPDLFDERALDGIPAHSLDSVLMVNNHLTAAATERLLLFALQLLRPAGTLVLGDSDDRATSVFTSRDEALRAACTRGFVLVDELRPSRYHYALQMRAHV